MVYFAAVTPTFQMHSEMQQHTLVFFGMPHRLGKPNNNNNDNNNTDNTNNNDIYPGSSTHPTKVFTEVMHPIELEFGNVDF